MIVTDPNAPVPYDVGYYPEGCVPYDRQFSPTAVQHDSVLGARQIGLAADEGHIAYRPDDEQGLKHCVGSKKDGTPCKGWRTEESFYCAGHLRSQGKAVGDALVYLAGLTSPDPLR